jgi:hypothetical protein
MKLTHLLAAAVAATFAPCALAGNDFALDFAKNANMDFADEVAGDGKGGWSDQGPENDLRGFDVSRRDFGGMTFSIVDPARNNGKAVMTFDNSHARTGLTEATFDLAQERPEARFLYLLHTSCWNQERAGTPVGAVEILLEDGSRVEKPVRAGIDVTDWWNAGNSQNAIVVYRKSNGSTEVGVSISKFELADKDARIKSVTIKSNGKVVWIVLGATLSSRDLELKDKEIVFTANDEWKTVDMADVQVKAGTALDLSAISEPGPAGKHGRFMVAPDGSLAFEASPDVPRRLLGFNGLFSSMRKFDSPDKETTGRRIATYAELVKRQGYDMIRPLVSDIYLMEGSTVAATPNPVKLDNFDRLIAELKARGIYIYLTIAAYRLGMADPWSFSDAIENGHYKNRMYIGEETVRANWKTLAETMLNHVNPYTGIAWKDEPAIACVEFYNEQEIGMSRIAKIPPELRQLFSARWRAWLLEKYRTAAAVASAWSAKGLSEPGAFEALEIPEDIHGSSPQANDFGLFFRDLARVEMAWCEGIVRGTGYPGLISQFNFSKQIHDSAIRWETSELVSMNTYYNHPTEFSRPGSKCKQNSSAGQAVSHWRDANATRLADRPLFITEHNHAFWNKYQHEAGLLFAAYSALQGFAEVTVHEDAVTLEVTEPNIDFSVARSPVARANEFIAACLFRRGDVKAAAHRVELQVPASFLHAKANGNRAVGTEQSKIALMTGFSIAFPERKRPQTLASAIPPPDLAIGPDGGATITAGDWASSVAEAKDSTFSLQDFVAQLKAKGILPADNLSDPAAGIFQSETGEITLRTKENLVKVVTPRTEGVSLEADQAEALSCLSVAGSSVPAAIAACAVDGKPLASSARIVLVYSTEIANTGMALSEDRVTLRNIGTLPVLMRTGKLKATLTCAAAARMALYPLRIDGTRREALPVSAEGETLTIEIDTATLKDGPTPFFELVAE